MSKNTYVERALFMLGEQNTGKSVQLRSMFRDWRFGNKGVVPDKRNIANTYPLSNERWLYLRLTSPHESDETLKEFLDKCAAQMQPGERQWCRWNFAGALQRSATGKLADGPAVIDGFIKRFDPERVRAVILTPDYLGNRVPDTELTALTGALYALPGVEVMTADAMQREANGLMYADFFDFT